MDKRNDVFSISRYGEELVEAMPDREAVAAVHKKWKALLRKDRKRGMNAPKKLEQQP